MPDHPSFRASAAAETSASGEQERLQYRLAQLQNVLGLERKLRRSKDQQTKQLRLRLQQVSRLAREARVREQNLSQRLQDPDATRLSFAGAQMQAAQLASASANNVSHAASHSHRSESGAVARSATAATQLVYDANQRSASVTLPTGFALHEYRIDRVLGQGGFGITYLATDINLNVKVAIKEYLPASFAYRNEQYSVQALRRSDETLYQTGLDNFLVEARTLATFRHPNIVRVARFFEAQHSAYIVLEYERGQPLRTAFKQAPAEQELLALLQPLLDGLSLVHEAGYLHRDIKPDNIYVRNDDGSLVLLDFGAAQHASSRPNELSSVLTPGYAPPEQYDGGQQGPWTDIYAFGATLYWLVTGHKPPAAPNRSSGAAFMQSALEAGQGRYSDAFLQAIDKALQLDVNLRPQSVAEFAQALFASHHATLGLQAALQRDDSDSASLFDWRENLALLRKSPQLLQRRLLQVRQKVLSPASWPLALKMILALTMAALLPMLITAYYNLNGSIEAVSSSELRNLERLAQSVAGRIAQLNADSHNLADFLATDEQFISYLRQPSEEGKKRVYEKIKHLHESNPDVHRVLLIGADGIVQIASDQSIVGTQSSFREYFQQAMAGHSFATGIIVSITDGSAGIFYSNPVFNADQKVIGAVVLRIKGATVDKLMLESTVGTGRIPFLIDGDGVMLSHPDRSQVFRSLSPLSQERQQAIAVDKRFGNKKVESLNMPELARVIVRAKDHGNLSYFSTISGSTEHAGYSPVRGHEWVVGISEPRSQFEAPLQRLFTHVLYSVLVVGLVFVLLAVWFARSIVRPIQRLTEAANALKEGDFDKANIHVSSNDEIGKLARTFNVMIDVLRQRERERRRGRSKGE